MAEKRYSRRPPSPQRFCWHFWRRRRPAGLWRDYDRNVVHQWRECRPCFHRELARFTKEREAAR